MRWVSTGTVADRGPLAQRPTGVRQSREWAAESPRMVRQVPGLVSRPRRQALRRGAGGAIRRHMISLYCPGRCYSRSAAADREPEARTRAAIAYRAYQRAEPGQNPGLGALPTRVPGRLTCLLLSWLIQGNCDRFRRGGPARRTASGRRGWCRRRSAPRSRPASERRDATESGTPGPVGSYLEHGHDRHLLLDQQRRAEHAAALGLDPGQLVDRDLEAEFSSGLADDPPNLEAGGRNLTLEIEPASA